MANPGEISFSDPHGVDAAGDGSRAIFNEGEVYNHVELNTGALLLLEEILGRSRYIVGTPGVFAATGDLTIDTDLQVASPGVTTVKVELGSGMDDLGQLIEVVAQQTVTVGVGDWDLYIAWAAADDTTGTFVTNYPTTGSKLTRRIRSFGFHLVAHSAGYAHGVLLARLNADGANPITITDARTAALLRPATVSWTNWKAAIADCIVQQGIPAVRTDQGTNSGNFYTYQKPGASGKIVVTAGRGLTSGVDVVLVSTDAELAVPNDATWYRVKLTPSATFGGESTVGLVADGTTSGFLVARVRRVGTTITVTDTRTRLLMRSAADDATLPATPIRLRASWGFESGGQQRGELDGIPRSSHQQPMTDRVWVRVRMGDGGTGVWGGAVFTKSTNEIGAWTNDEWIGHYVRFGGYSYQITDNTATTLTLISALPVAVGTSGVFDIVPGSAYNVWQIQSKRNDVAIVPGEVEEVKPVQSELDEHASGWVTFKINDTWQVSHVEHNEEKQQPGWDYFAEAQSRVITFHNLPSGVPHRVRCQARGGLSPEFWSPWSAWNIIVPTIPAAERVKLNPSVNVIRIEPKPGGLRVMVDWSAGDTATKAAADLYYAGTEIAYTEGESVTSLSQIGRDPADTPVLPEPWAAISVQTVKAVHIVTPGGRNIQIMAEPLCRVRMVIRHILRDGSVTATYEVAYEGGTTICASPRTPLVGYGTQPQALDAIISTGIGGSAAAGATPVVIVGYVNEVNATGVNYQKVRTVEFADYFGIPGVTPIEGLYYTIRAIMVRCRTVPTNGWIVRFTITGSPNKVYNVNMMAGETEGRLLIDETLELYHYHSGLLEIESEAMAAIIPQGVHIEIITKYAEQYVPAEE